MSAMEARDDKPVAPAPVPAEGVVDTFQPRQPRAPRSRADYFEVPDDPSAAERAARRRAARRLFRLFCIACARSSEGSTVAERPRRCTECGGTMVLEWAPE
jgi:hypothetical protein